MSEKRNFERASCALEFETRTRDLIQALDCGDALQLPALVAAQQASFEALSTSEELGTLGRARLEHLHAEGCRALELSRARLLEVRQEIDLLRDARVSARRSRPAAEPARFFSQRI